MADKLNSDQLEDQCEEALRQVYKDLERLGQLYREKLSRKPTKEQAIACLERIFNELEEGKIVLAPPVRDRF